MIPPPACDCAGVGNGCSCANSAGCGGDATNPNCGMFVCPCSANSSGTAGTGSTCTCTAGSHCDVSNPDILLCQLQLDAGITKDAYPVDADAAVELLNPVSSEYIENGVKHRIEMSLINRVTLPAGDDGRSKKTGMVLHAVHQVYQNEAWVVVDADTIDQPIYFKAENSKYPAEQAKLTIDHDGEGQVDQGQLSVGVQIAATYIADDTVAFQVQARAVLNNSTCWDNNAFYVDPLPFPTLQLLDPSVGNCITAPMIMTQTIKIKKKTFFLKDYDAWWLQQLQKIN